MDYSFGSWIKRRRKALNLTRDELAQHIGCSPSTIYKIETDERQPSLQIAELLSKHLLIPPEQHVLFLKVARHERAVDHLAPLPAPLEPLPTPVVLKPAPNLPGSRSPIPLVGRVKESQQLEQVYHLACAGQAQTACVIGEAGMGKTRLAAVFLQWAQSQPHPADVLSGRAFEMGGALPYQPILDALRARLEPDDTLANRLSAVWLAELTQLLPELSERFPDLPAPLTGADDFVRARLFEAVARLGMALAAQQPLVLFIDDLQWADSSTLDLLHYLARRWSSAGTRAVLLCTLRQEGLLTQPALQSWLADLARSATLTRLDLSPLVEEDLLQIIQAIAVNGKDRTAVHHRLADYLLVETGGSPFFISEVILALQEDSLRQPATSPAARAGNGTIKIDLHGTLRRIESAGRLPLPPNVRQVILVRLARLSEPAQALLLASAVIGRNSSYERLCRVARLDAYESLPALEELLRGRMMLETSAEARPYNIAHDNIRDVVYTEAGVTRRQLMHRQAFVIFEADGEPAAELAFHAAAARLDAPSFRYSIAAGNNAVAFHAYAEAVTHYRRALGLLDHGSASSAERCQLCTNYGRALELTGQYRAALAHYQAMAQLAERANDPALALAALIAHSAILTSANEISDYAQAEKLGQQALRMARDLADQAAEAKVQWILLNSFRMTHRNEQALAAGEQSLALTQQLGLREQMAYTANDLVYVHTVVGDVDRTLELTRMATSLWRELGNQPMLTDSLTSTANMLAWMGQYEAALAAASEGLQVARALENQWAISNSLISVALVHGRRMAVDPAFAAIDESLRLGKAVGFVGAQVMMNAKKAMLYLLLGDLRRARPFAEQAFSVARRFPLVYASAAAALVILAIESGRLDEAAEIFATIPNQPALDIFNGLAREAACCHLLLAQNRFEEAYSLSCTALEFAQKRRLAMFVPDFRHYQGQALLGLGQCDQARETLEDALAALQAAGGRSRCWQITQRLAGIAEEQGDRKVAQRWRETTRSAMQEIAGQISDRALRESILKPGVTE